MDVSRTCANRTLRESSVSLHEGLMHWCVCRSAFFCFCNEERPKVKAKYPNYAVSEVAKELGKRWEACTSRTKFEQLAAKDRQRYEKVSQLNDKDSNYTEYTL